MRLPRIFIACHGQSLGKTTLARLIHNALPSGSSLICLGTGPRRYPYLDSALRSCLFKLQDSEALPRLLEIIRHHRVILLDVASADHQLAELFLTNPKLITGLGELNAHSMIVTPQEGFHAFNVRRPSSDHSCWEDSPQALDLPTLPRGICERLAVEGLPLPAALGDQRRFLDHPVDDWLEVWESLCTEPLLKLLERPLDADLPLATAI